MQHKTHRILYLDGLRGVAIFFVILFHAYSRWPMLVPYGSEFRDFPLFIHGWLGVQLFFLISGFVANETTIFSFGNIACIHGN